MRSRLDKTVVPFERSGPITNLIHQLAVEAQPPAKAGKPILYIDVDGVISLWGFAPNSRPDGAFASVDGILHFLSSEAGAHLHGLRDTYELVWCTGWEEKADEHLPHALGVPSLRGLEHLSFDRPTSAGTSMPGHWKLAAVDEHAGGRPVAWVDDALNDACEAWAAERAAPTLLVHTEPARGLIAEHAALLTAWADALSPTSPGAR